MSELIVAAVDVGSIRKGNFGWFRRAGTTTADGRGPEGLVSLLGDDLAAGGRVALGFECPLFVPLPQQPEDLGSRRPGEGNRPWSVAAGAASLTTGLQQVAWLLWRLGDEALDITPTLHWHELQDGTANLLVWEAFVSGAGKPTPRPGVSGHVADAEAAVEEFNRRVSRGDPTSDSKPVGQVYSLVGAALLRAGLTTELDVLAQPALVVRLA